MHLCGKIRQWEEEPNRKIGLGFFAYLVDAFINNLADLQ
jgi:hypothetical protein